MNDEQIARPQPPPAASDVTTAPVSVSRLGEVGAAVLALVLWALLADAAVETFVGDAPVRWWVAGVVAAYLGLTAVMWRVSGRRFGWSVHATASFSVLLGLLAFTAWLPDGLTDGIVVLGQSTSAVLSIVSALFVAAAAVILARTRLVPRVGVLAVACAAGYGVAAFVIGAREGTQFPSLFDGEAFWSRAPMFLQGATVGAFGVVPAALLAVLVSVVARSATGTRRRLFYAVPLAVALLLSARARFEASVVPDTRVSASASDPEVARIGQFTADSTRQIEGARSPAEAVAAFYETLQKAADQTAAPADTPLSASAMDTDPRNMVAALAKELRYEHYSGILRGPGGVLASRAGNSCDQSLLVRERLKARGIPSVLMVAPSTTALNDGLIQIALNDAAVSAASYYAVGGARFLALAGLLDEILDTSPALRPSFESIQTPSFVSTYCWVRALLDNQEIVLDPIGALPPEGLPGAVAHDTAPSSLHHRVALRLVLEVQEGDGLRDRVLQTASYQTDTLGFTPLTVSILPGPPATLERLGAPDPLSVLDDVATFYPVIVASGQRKVGEGFNLAGELVTAQSSPLPGIDGLGTRLGGMFGSRSSEQRPAATPPSAAPSGLRGLRLEHELIEPGEPPVLVTRSLVDAHALSETRRVAEKVLAIVHERQIIVPTHAATDEFVTARLIDYYHRHRARIEAVLVAKQTLPDPDVEPLEMHLLALAQAQDAVARALNRPGKSVVWRARPAVLTFKKRFAVQAGAVARLVGIDIGTTGFEAISTVESSRKLQAQMGLHSTFIESEIVNRTATSSESESMMSLSGHAKAQGIGLSARTPSSVPVASREPMSWTRQRGHAIIAFAKPVKTPVGQRFGWWELDPQSGEILGILENGEGGAQSLEAKLKTGATVGIVSGAAVGYLYCTVGRGYSSSSCVGYTLCGAAFGGMAGAFGVFAPSATMVGAILSGVFNLGKKVCEGRFPEPDPNDADHDGIPNDDDDDDNNNGVPDTRDPDDDGDGHEDCDSLPSGSAQPGVNCDALPGDETDYQDADGDRQGDRTDPDDDNDRVPDCPGQHCDQFPNDPSQWQDADHDGIGDQQDSMVDADHDGIDDQQDPCSRYNDCRFGPDTDGDHDPDHRDPAVDESGLHSYPEWNRNWKYPNGPHLPGEGNRPPRNWPVGPTGWPTRTGRPPQ